MTQDSGLMDRTAPFWIVIDCRGRHWKGIAIWNTKCSKIMSNPCVLMIKNVFSKKAEAKPNNNLHYDKIIFIKICSVYLLRGAPYRLMFVILINCQYNANFLLFLSILLVWRVLAHIHKTFYKCYWKGWPCKKEWCCPE